MTGASLTRLVRDRMAADRVLVLAACLTALFATTVLAALAGYTGSVSREGLRRTLARADFATAGTRIAGPVPAGEFGKTQRAMDALVRDTYRKVPVAASVSARSDSYTLPGRTERGRPRLTAFATFAGIERHARITQGRWPAPGGVVEAALPEPAARAMKLTAGATLTLRGRVDSKSVVRVKVSGVFAVDRAADWFWQGDRLVTTGSERLDYLTLGPFVVPPDTFAARFTGTGTYARWALLPDMRGASAGELAALGRRTAVMRTRLMEGRLGVPYNVVTSLPTLAGQLQAALRVTRSTMLIPVLQLIVLAGYALMLVARLLADHRRGEVALLRTRGAGLPQLARLTAGEGLLVALPAAVLAPLLAGPLLRLAAYAPVVRASGLRLDPGPLSSRWAVSAGSAAVCALLLTLPTLRGAARTYVQTQADRGRDGRRGLAQRSGADLALLVVAALGVWQLARYGGPVRAAKEGEAAGSIDPFIVSGPALALLAGGLLVLRSVPLVSRLAERLIVRGRGLAPALGAWQVGRRPVRYAGPVLLLVMAMAVGVLSVSTITTWRHSQLAQADFQAGPDLRIGVSQDPRGAQPLGQGAPIAALPGVAQAGPVVRRETGAGGQNVTLLAGDALAMRSMLPSGYADGTALAALAAARTAPVVSEVPGRPATITFAIRLTRAQGWSPPEEFRGFTLGVTMADGRGLHHRLELPGLVPDGRVRRVTLRPAELAGPGGGISYPLSIRGFHYSYAANPYNPRMQLDVLSVSGDGGAQARLPAGHKWTLVAHMKGRPAVTTDPRSLLTVGIPESAVSEPDSPYVANNESFHTVLIDPRARAGGSGDSSGRLVLPPVPGLITADLAARARAKVGGTVLVGTPDGDQPVKVAGVMRALPTTDPDRPAILVDLPALTERRLAAGADPSPPTEWWADLRGGHTAAAMRGLAGRPGITVVDRAELRHKLRDAPLGGALQGALILGFMAGLAFAFIGFVVNAAVSAGERSAEFAVLRALGVRARQLLGMLLVEQTFLISLGLAGGTLLGLAISRLVVPHMVLTVRAAAPYPPVDVIVDWATVGAMLTGVAVFLGMLLLLSVRMMRRRGLGRDLRMGERT